jgi:hypothetical protein
MKNRIILIFSIFVIAAALTACAHEAAIPLGNDMMEIDTSVAPVYGRAGAERIAINKAAEATLAMGYDKFIVVNNGGWNETTVGGGSQSTFNANATQMGGSAFGQQSSGWGTTRHPEAKMIIRMFHNGDKDSEKAVDARLVLSAANQ